MRPDKAKVVDEIWDEERLNSFLDKGPMGNEDADFSMLLHAYRSMRADDFSRFIKKFEANGGSVTAPSKDGRTLAQTIEKHVKAAPFIEILAGRG